MCVGVQGVEGGCIHCHPVAENITKSVEILKSRKLHGWIYANAETFSKLKISSSKMFVFVCIQSVIINVYPSIRLTVAMTMRS